MPSARERGRPGRQLQAEPVAERDDDEHGKGDRRDDRFTPAILVARELETSTKSSVAITRPALFTTRPNSRTLPSTMAIA